MIAALMVAAWVLLAIVVSVWIGAAARIAKRRERGLQAHVAGVEVAA